jgi:hypothetical protein
VRTDLNMTKDELVEDLRLRIGDLQDTVDKAMAVRSFVDQDLLTEEQAIDEQADLLNQLVQKSEAISDLIDEFLESSPDDSEMAAMAGQIVSAARDQITQFQDKEFLKDQDIADQTGEIQ